MDELSERLNSILHRINKNLKPLEDLKRKIRFQTQKMKNLHKNIEECLCMVRLK